VLGWPLDPLTAENGAVALFSNKKCLQPNNDVRKPLSKSYRQDAPERQANQFRMQRLAHRLTPEAPGAVLA
jgi:hypothetical protein